jgi:hypothetical protein
LKLNQVFVIPALLATLLLSACGEKSAETPAPETAPVVDAAPVVAPAPVAGGYTPTADEVVLGITRTKEEQDKINAAALEGTPMPAIPGEATPAATVAPPVADTEAAPVEASTKETAPVSTK